MAENALAMAVPPMMGGPHQPQNALAKVGMKEQADAILRRFLGPRGYEMFRGVAGVANALSPAADLRDLAQSGVDVGNALMRGEGRNALGAAALGAAAAGSVFLPGNVGLADEVAELLRTGRAAEVTDEMLAAFTPNDHARLSELYESGATGVSMPMDEASRMARAKEMGFGESTFHGIDGELVGGAFDVNAAGKVDSGYLGKGVYSSKSPRIAASYASRKASANFGEGAQNVLPITIKEGKQFSVSPDEKQSMSGLDTYSRWDWGSDRQAEGFSSVRVPYSPAQDGPRDEILVFDPRNIRSRFARFDPRLSHLANLTAGVGGVVFTNALLQAAREKESQERTQRE